MYKKTFKFRILQFQAAYPVKLKEVHIVNSTPLVDMAYKIVKPFLKEKLRKRVSILYVYTDT